MADISTELARILSAIYGEDVRGSIHDAIEKINDVSEVVLTTGTAVTGPSSSSTGFYDDSLYLNTDTFELWKCTGVNTWASQGILKGEAGDDGNGIVSIAKTATSGLVDTYTITYSNGTTSTFDVTNGADGTDGNDGNDGVSVTGVSLISKVGLLATYRMTFSNGTFFDYTVSDGASGSGTGDMTKAVYDTDNDGIVDAAETLSGLTATIADLNKTANLATVATSGSYNDLSNKPTIPAAVAVKGDAETTYRTGNVNLTKANIGLGNVGNFKAVSTVASQGLSDTEKSNARANIGAGTSSSDTKNTAGTTNSTSKLFLAGATSQAANPQTYSNVNCYASGGYLYSNGQKVSTDDWTATATVSSSGTVSFSGLNDSYGYKIYYTLPSGDSAYTFSKVTKSGSGTSVTLTFTTDAPSGTVCKLRILK